MVERCNVIIFYPFLGDRNILQEGKKMIDGHNYGG